MHARSPGRGRQVGVPQSTFVVHVEVASSHVPAAHVAQHPAPAAQSLQTEPELAWFGRQDPAALQVSGLVHAVFAAFPQAVPLGRNPLSWQAPAPSQVSWFVHAFGAAPQGEPALAWLPRQDPAPLHVSGAVHSLFVELPHEVLAGRNPLSWQTPDPSQVSWFVHAFGAAPQFEPALT